MMHFCYRGRDCVRLMKPSDFSVHTDENGCRYLTKRDSTLTKYRRENVDESSTGTGLMFEVPTSEKCPLKSYLTYVSKLNDNCPFLWQKPKSKVPALEDVPWYDNCPIGVNTISKKMKQISASAGCSKIYTNYCVRLVRARRITSLDSAAFESRDIAVGGHRSANSLKHYSEFGVERKREMSSHLSKKLCCTSSGTPAQSKKSVQLQRHDLSDVGVRSTVAGEEHNHRDHGTESEEMSITQSTAGRDEHDEGKVTTQEMETEEPICPPEVLTITIKTELEDISEADYIYPVTLHVEQEEEEKANEQKEEAAGSCGGSPLEDTSGEGWEEIQSRLTPVEQGEFCHNCGS
ncbi:uncharacterized protein [Diadema antillarum]|uniref:uncharacterized protein n=1 Tax=Diadema antillarum TaxID=105358 RepID=UPI003A8AE8A4